MKTTYVSTFAMSAATRRSVMEMQAELTARQKELSTQRVADAGLALGAHTGQVVALRRDHASLQAIIDSNATVAGRLDATQGALTGITDGAHQFLGVLIDARSTPEKANVTLARAEEKLASLIGQLNATHAGQHLFAGINTGVAPIAAYSPGSTPKQAVDDAFLARFGFAQSDPAASSISGADMQDFLDIDFAALFDDTGWPANWSSATDGAIRARVSTGATVSTGETANHPAIRKLTMAYTMMADLGITNLSAGAYDALVSTATGLVGESIQEVTHAQARLGTTQETVTTASERMSVQMDVLAKHINALEGVDPYEAAMQVTSLLTQIETSYAMTARLQRLSLLNYL